MLNMVLRICCFFLFAIHNPLKKPLNPSLMLDLSRNLSLYFHLEIPCSLLSRLGLRGVENL